jgi:hypothetical protein
MNITTTRAVSQNNTDLLIVIPHRVVALATVHLLFFLRVFFDDFVKSPTSVLRCILRHCGVPVSTPHSSGFARLEFEAFYFVARFPTFTLSSTLNSINFYEVKKRCLLRLDWHVLAQKRNLFTEW